MSLDNAKRNLEAFGKELGLGELAFDENNTCILGIDDTFSLHITYEPNSKKLYIYSPLLDGLPSDEKTRLRLYETLMEGSMLGGQMAGGGVGVAVKEELILMHCTIEMEFADETKLKSFAPVFVQSVEEWRGIVADICAGRSFVTPFQKMREKQAGGGAPGIPGAFGGAPQRSGSVSEAGGGAAAGGGTPSKEGKKPSAPGGGGSQFIKISPIHF